jgi:ubiquitin-activating enzyme E1
MSDKMDVDTPDHQKVDENLYSRQLYVLGHETMRKMQTTHILLAGLGGLGVEVAKNIILMGVKAVTLYDPRPVSWDDLCTNFYASEADVGKPRADVVLPKLAELNQYVQVQVFKGELTDAVLKGFQVIAHLLITRLSVSLILLWRSSSESMESPTAMASSSFPQTSVVCLPGCSVTSAPSSL